MLTNFNLSLSFTKSRSVHFTKNALKYNLNNGVIILTDLYLYELPSIELIYNQTQEMKSTFYQYEDEVCAIGKTVKGFVILQ